MSATDFTPPHRAITPVRIPEFSHSADRCASCGGDHLQATVSCGTGQSLLDYDPAAGTSTVLLGPPVNGGGVIGGLPHPCFE